MRDPWTVLRRPVVTEKTTRLAQSRTYTFVVEGAATKPEIRHAVEKTYKVKVEDVRTAVYKGKRKRMKNMRLFGERKDWKKAYVTLQEGHRLDVI